VLTSAGNYQKVQCSFDTAAGATSIPVHLFTANHLYPASGGTNVWLSTAWNSVTIQQLTDNSTLAIPGTSPNVLPLRLLDTLDIYCDPESSQGMSIKTTISGGDVQTSIATASSLVYPIVEPGNTHFQITIVADWQPTTDLQITWTPRFQS
jgi:hypothetical protein